MLLLVLVLAMVPVPVQGLVLVLVLVLFPPPSLLFLPLVPTYSLLVPIAPCPAGRADRVRVEPRARAAERLLAENSRWTIIRIPRAGVVRAVAVWRRTVSGLQSAGVGLGPEEG